ncbi:unnamed protein product, partial [Rotaria sp. Silwood2]
MHSCLESFSTEVVFEIFKYLSSIDLYRGFAGLNGRLQRILNLYPLRLNLQLICRSDLDFLCHHIQPKQVISIVLSEETIPDQVKIFLKYFPRFEHQFICLQSVNFIKTENYVIVCSIVGIEISFNLLEQNLNNLPRLTHLTIEATGTLDLLDGVRWEKFLRRRELIKFNFKFSLSLNLVCNQDQFSLLEPFRSSFWLEEKHWYVACYKNEWGNKCPIIFSVPYAIHHSIAYLTEIYPPLSTASSDMEKQLFYDTNINHLECYFPRQDRRQTYTFTKVNSLRLIGGSSSFNLNILTSTVDLGRVRILDVSSVDHISTSQLRDLLEHTPRLYHLTMRQQNQSFILLSHIRSLHLKRSLSHDTFNFANIDQLRCELLHIVQLEIKVQTQELMIEIIERFDQLESIIFQWSGYLLEKYTSSEWFQQNTRRLHENNFTCRRESERERGEPRRK